MKRRLKDVECLYCGKTFRPKHSYNKYCSITCFQNDTKIEKQCLNCGKTFITSGAHASIQKYCSAKCKNGAKIKKKCLGCGEEFIGKRKTKYCDNCHQRECITCGKVFYGKPNDVTCSPKCYDYYRRHQQTEKKCENCGVIFEGPFYKKYCCEKCMVECKLKKTSKTCNEKYGVPYVILREDVQEKNGKTYSTTNRKIKKGLEALGYNVECEYKIGRGSFDFKIGDILIEYNPTYTHSPDIKTHYMGHKMFGDYHKNKTALAMTNGFRCIHIFERDSLEKIEEIINQAPPLCEDRVLVDMSKGDYMWLLNNGYTIIDWTAPVPHYVKYKNKDVRVFDSGIGTFKLETKKYYDNK